MLFAFVVSGRTSPSAQLGATASIYQRRGHWRRRGEDEAKVMKETGRHAARTRDASR